MIIVTVYGTTRFLKMWFSKFSVPRGDCSGVLQGGLSLFESKINCVLEPALWFRDIILSSVDLVRTRNSKWVSPLHAYRSIALFASYKYSIFKIYTIRNLFWLFSSLNSHNDSAIQECIASLTPCALFTLSVLFLLNFYILVWNMIYMFLLYNEHLKGKYMDITRIENMHFFPCVNCRFLLCVRLLNLYS